MTDQVATPALTARVQCVITGGADGEISCGFTLDGGKLADMTSGRFADSDVTFTTPHEEAASMLQGELNPCVAYMRGDLKAGGDLGKLIQLLSLTTSSSYGRFRAKLSQITNL